MTKFLTSFFAPRLNRRYVLRLLLVSASAYLLFGFVFRPFWIHGQSMEPTYKDGRLILGFMQRYWFRGVARGDIVLVRMAGKRVMYLKRIVAMGGETVEFRDGVLYVDDEAQVEPWVKSACDWNLPKRTVDHGFVYVIGDNRGMAHQAHGFGQVSTQRILGGPLW